jgi:hypothetical protein
MERLAYQNMIYKSKNGQIRPPVLMTPFSQPTGEVTSKAKINSHINNYYFERQSKNSPNYDSFITALNSNISEDQQRTSVNNEYLLTEQTLEDNLGRVCHPTLMTEQEKSFHNADRCGLGVGTRDRQMNAFAKNKNTTHPDMQSNEMLMMKQSPTPMPKLNYPQGYDQLQPLCMDMSSQLDTQFGVLTNPYMDQQIAHLNQSVQQTQVCDQTSNPVMDRMGTDYACKPAYNPCQLPPQQLMVEFQRPISSNVKIERTDPPQPRRNMSQSMTAPVLPTRRPACSMPVRAKTKGKSKEKSKMTR